MPPSLYDPRFEHDACGVGFLARVGGPPSHELLRLGLSAVARLEHRGAVAADGGSGDGAGVLIELPEQFLRREARLLGVRPRRGGRLGLGMVFLPQSEEDAGAGALERALEAQQLRVLGWREVPVQPAALGEAARGTMPSIRQVLVGAEGRVGGAAEFERRLYLAQKAFERSEAPGYVCSLSARTVVYKALGAGHQLAAFYGDLRDPQLETRFVVYHQRYSTNTLPSWAMAQPFRMLAHNGEINTLWGNRAWMRVREAELPAELCPVLVEGGSDSSALDAALVLLTRNGRDLAHALSMLITPAWEEPDATLSADVRAFYHANAPLIEPWDGPAAVAFADGRYVGAALDRNGLRPCRYKLSADGLLVAGSEVGVVELDEDAVVERGRLGPGQMLAVDLAHGRLLRDGAIRRRLTRYAAPRWTGVTLPSAPAPAPPAAGDPTGATLTRLQRQFALDAEQLKLVLAPMVEEAKDATWSMGDDTAVAPLAPTPRPLYDFFRQRFAQVTNPAIDPLRERSVMSIRTWLGPRPPLVVTAPPSALIELERPVLTDADAAAIRAQAELPVREVDCTFAPDEPLSTAIERLATSAASAVEDGAALLLLTDRGVTHGRVPVPMPLVVGAVHHRLVDARLRARAGLVVEAGDCWDVHHLAVLIGCGAAAVWPWLAIASAAALGTEHGEQRLIEALCGGLRKVMSKMGISTVASYRGGELFEVLGLADDVVARCFPGMPSAIGGLGFDDLAADAVARHRAAFADAEAPSLPDPGRIRYRRSDEAESHAWSPQTVRALQLAVGSARGKGPEPGVEPWQEFRRLSAGDAASQLRDLLELVPAADALPLAAVEPVEAILPRFASSAMSLGALSPEAHRALTIAMNRLGARSNSGEGGEDAEVYGQDGPDRLDNKIKQVASGRFGVTAEYLARAEELEIKIAQGSKPGEGGQLPGHKVSALIARLRHAQPGIPLISPPPHHDIYSIEDIAQLIYDLKRVNPRARVGVKLVAEAGVGTIAAGVAKAYADFVVISGHAGGTGASPLTSIKYAGSPWELGLAEAQQVLVRNALRGRVRLRTDGGLRSARDVVVAALLGADEFAFGTAPLVALGCDMARQCHRNTCPTGIATQRPELRAKFRGSPEHVVQYFLRLAEDVRALLAALGLARLDDAIGRVELLRQAAAPHGIRLDRLLARPERHVGWSAAPDAPAPLRCVQPRNDRPEPTRPLEDALLERAAPAIAAGTPFRAVRVIHNHDRAVGARFGGEVALRHGNALAPDTIRLRFRGAAGQSFGAFAATGVTLVLDGEANDYVGKGLSGGTLVLRPRGAIARRAPHRHVILGNVALYGATGGRLFAAGRAGERFAIRNSGAVAVVEGLGDHGCEYMTGGTIVVLGRTGANFGAGMTGGTAYVLDMRNELADRINADSIVLTRLDAAERRTLGALLREHVRRTHSPRARRLLRRWDHAAGWFWKAAPPVTAPVDTPAAAPARSPTRRR